MTLENEFVEIHGDMPKTWRDIRERQPQFFEAYVNLAAVPLRRGALTAKARALIMIAVNAAVTHLNRNEIRHHIGRALDHGASAEEIVEVLQLVSVLGIHAISIGFPALQDIAAQAGKADDLPSIQFDGHQTALKENFTQTRGYWNPFWEQALRLDPPLFEAYFNFSSVPWKFGILEPKLREFVYIAIDASTTHMFDDGTRGHMANAFKHGAKVEEILEVLELCVPIGVQSMTTGLDILEEEMAARQTA